MFGFMLRVLHRDHAVAHLQVLANLRLQEVTHAHRPTSKERYHQAIAVSAGCLQACPFAGGVSRDGIYTLFALLHQVHAQFQ